MSSEPRLLHFRISHYNEKVRWALDHKGWPHIRESLTPGFHVPRLRLLTGQQKLPVLILDGKPICGSSTILDEIEKRRPDPPLLPERPEDQKRAKEIEAHFDDVVAPDLRRLFWSSYFSDTSACTRMATMGSSGIVRLLFRIFFPVMRPVFRRNMRASVSEIDASKKRLIDHFDRLESHIGESGYLAGDRFSRADIAAAAVVSAVLRPPQFSYPLPEPWPEALTAIRAMVADHAASKWAVSIYERHRGTSAEIAPLAT